MKRLAGCSLIIVLSAAVTLSVAARDIDQDEALRLRQQGDIMALEKLLGIATSLYPGARLLEAELEEDDDIFIYEVELITSKGVVREIEIDARSGRILKDEEDD
jgi:uncharacterized membrane protein YkoI